MLFSWSTAWNIENIKFIGNLICPAYTSALKMETSGSSKISVIKYQTIAFILNEVGNKNLPFPKIAFCQRKTLPEVCKMSC
jgi:hypothetical protein